MCGVMQQPAVVAKHATRASQNLRHSLKFWHHTYILQQPLIIAKQKTQAFLPAPKYLLLSQNF